MRIMTAVTIVVLGLIVSFAALASEPEKGLGPREGTLKVGDPAPDFTLKSPGGKTTFALSAFKGKKPVVLVFGSYT